MKNMSQDKREKALFSLGPLHRELDAVNVRVLRELQKEPRLSMTELGRRVGLSSPSVTERVRRLEQRGVILGYRLEIDPAALGLPISAYIRIRPNPGQLPKVAGLAREIPQVEECHRVTGEDCFVLKVHIPAIDQLDRLLDLFLAHGSTATTIIQSSPVPLRTLPLPENGAP
jgi:Lrp/AsnC family transcriptional regulator, leucine-responsive regulatory protein